MSDGSGEINPLNEEEIKDILSKLYWDAHVDPAYLYQLLIGKTDRIGHIDLHSLYYRILTSLSWYDILKIVPQEKIGDLLSDSVLEKIRFKDLKDRYLYARERLLQ